MNSIVSRRVLLLRYLIPVLALGKTVPLFAQQYQSGTVEAPGRTKLERPAGDQQQRPAPEVMQTPIDPELERILKYWEYLGTKTTSLQGKHARFTYDFTFKVEKRADGEWYYETPDKGRLDINPVKIDAKNSVVNTVNRYDNNGKVVKEQMNVESDIRESWLCDGKSVTLIHVDKREYEKIAIPAEAQGKAIEDGPLPFLFGIAAEKAKVRYRMELLPEERGGKHDLSKGIIHIAAYPLWKQDANNFTMAEILLDSKTFFPTAIKLVHPGNNQWTTYLFHDVKRNENRNVFNFWKDPFNPNLIGFKEISIPTAPAQGNMPAPQVANPPGNTIPR